MLVNDGFSLKSYQVNSCDCWVKSYWINLEHILQRNSQCCRCASENSGWTPVRWNHTDCCSSLTGSHQTTRCPLARAVVCGCVRCVSSLLHFSVSPAAPVWALLLCWSNVVKLCVTWSWCNAGVTSEDRFQVSDELKQAEHKFHSHIDDL